MASSLASAGEAAKARAENVWGKPQLSGRLLCVCSSSVAVW